MSGEGRLSAATPVSLCNAATWLAALRAAGASFAAIAIAAA